MEKKLNINKTSFGRNLFNTLFNVVEQMRRHFITIHERPFSAKQIKIESTNYPYPRTAIVIQGPVVEKRNFTLETVRFYKGLFKETEIILATWADISSSTLSLFQKESIHVVRTSYPEHNGRRNINLQLASTQAGIKKAEELGVTHVLKTRTDQRFHNPHLLAFLHNLHKTFPSLEKYPQQKERIIVGHQGTSKYKIYDINDQFQFGTLSDMKMFWNIPLVAPDKELPSTETHLFTTYLKKLGRELDWTNADSLEALATTCIVVDKQSIDLYWYKYIRHREYRMVDYKYRVHDLSFSEWLILYNQYNA